MLQVKSITEGRRVVLHGTLLGLPLHRSFNITVKSDGLNCSAPVSGILWNEAISVAEPEKEYSITVVLKNVWRTRLGLEEGQKISIDKFVHDPSMICLESSFKILFEDDIDRFFEERFGPLEKREAQPV